MKTYTIKKGDTLSSIAKNTGVEIKELMTINNISNPNNINAGQVINLSKNTEEEISLNKLTKENLNEKINSFLNYIEGKKLKRPLNTLGRESVSLIFQTCRDHDVTDFRMISYILATAFWETGAYKQRYIFEPAAEQGYGKGKSYGIAHKKTGKIYYGRGFVQLTWFDNYERFTRILKTLGFNVDLVNYPEMALEPKISALILVLGMKEGRFTGRSLNDYFTKEKTDWYNARRIINGIDKAVIIKDIATEFYFILK